MAAYSIINSVQLCPTLSLSKLQKLVVDREAWHAAKSEKVQS